MENNASDNMISQFKGYRLKDFRYILDALLDWAGDLKGLEGKSVLELGPGTKLNLLKFLKQETAAARVSGVGKTIKLMKSDSSLLLSDSYILPFIKKQKAKTFDVIYSRHLFEANSIHPFLLIKHPVYWNTIKENRFGNPGSDFPSSIANMQAIFFEAYRLIKPSGLLIAQIGKRKYSALTPDFLNTLKPRPKQIKQNDFGKFSQIITVDK